MSEKVVRGRVGVDFTEGNIYKHLIMFGLPLLASSFLQQLYNAVDTMVIGKFEGTIGTVGVGNGGEIATVITFVAMAFSNAGQIYISQLVGARDKKRTSESIGTIFTFNMLMGLVFGVLSIILCRPLLHVLNTPEEAMGEAFNYMVIVSVGLPAVFGYNAVCGVLRGMGESRRPLQFIIVATITNIVLDVLLVAVIPLAAAGTAIATVLAQVASFIAALMFLYKNRDRFGFDFKLKSFKLIREHMSILLQLGLPLTFKSCMIHMTQLYCSAQINEFGLVASATNSIGNRIYRLIHVGTTAIAGSTGAMIGQNMGARKIERTKQIVYASMKTVTVLAVFESALVSLFPRQIFGLFIDDPAVIEYGVYYMYIIVIACFLTIFQTPFEGLVTGCGKSDLSFLSGILDGFVFRLGIGIPLSFVIGAPAYWLGNNIAHLAPVIVCGAYFYSGKWKDHVLLKNSEIKE
ncbi:MAG: MATE family efflux transporter [Oscillospiraceae bacterium]|nr:MATE family efflux transporter [Oscillospiraceae bacterium]